MEKINKTKLTRLFLVVAMLVISANAVSALSWQKNGEETMNLNDYGNLLLKGNLTLAETVTFGFGEVLDNIVDGWLTVTGNLDVTGNMTIDGTSLTVNGQEVCLEDGTNCQAVASGNDGDDIYLYNSSGTMYLNETKLNQTINTIASAVDTDTNISSDGNYLSDDGATMSFDETKLNATIDARADVDTDTQKTTDGVYVYNDSTTIYLNETLLNATIDTRAAAQDTDTNCTIDGTCAPITYDSETTNWDKNASDDLTDATSHGGDVTGTYDNLQIISNAIGDNEINYTEVTVSDFTNDANYTSRTADETITGTWTFDDDVVINENLYVVGNISNVAVSNLNINGTTAPAINNQFDLGTNAERWKDLYLSGNAYIAGTLFVDNLNGLLHWDNITNKPTNLDTDSTNDLTTATTFSGDVSGTYNAMVVADDSHNHNWNNITNTPANLDTDASNDVNTTTNFGGDVSGTYNNIQIGTDVIGDTELNLTEITLSDFTDDASYMNSTEVASLYVPYTGATGDVDLGSNGIKTDNMTVSGGDEYQVYHNGTDIVIKY